MLQIPFYKNRGHRCGQAAMKCALGAVNPGSNLTYEALDRLTIHERREITYLAQIAAGLESLGVKYSYFIKPNFFDIVFDRNKFENNLRFIYGSDAQKLLDFTNYNSLLASARKIENSPNLHVRKIRPAPDVLKECMELADVPICLVNFDKFVCRENHFAGHYLILADIDLNNQVITYHDTGPKDAGPNKKASLERFLKAWGLCFLDYDTLLVRNGR